jgi:uncharacterized protein YndB with AHSA1/START domain
VRFVSLTSEALMPDILQDFPIKAPRDQVFRAVSTPAGLDAWWTGRAAGEPVVGATYELGFGPEYDWRADLTRCASGREFELSLTTADADWTGTRVGFRLEDKGDAATWVAFSHTGWPDANEHYRVSCHCWAMYLRLLRRYLERGEVVPYADRLDV